MNFPENNAVTRRDFLKMSAHLAALLGLGAAMTPQVAQALTWLANGRIPVLWLEGSNCSGCSISLLNSYPQLPLSLLTKHISLQFHQTLSTIQGSQAVDVVNATIQRGGYVLVVEGGVPGGNGAGIPQACTFGGENFKSLVLRAAQSATHIVAVGTCAAWGGVAAAAPNLIGATSVVSYLQGQGISVPFIRVPGCPPHPDWIVGTLVYLHTVGVPALDANYQPTAFYSTSHSVHSACPLEGTAEVTQLGEPGCVRLFGCRGPTSPYTASYADCAARGWNGIKNSCTLSLSPCIGCVQSGFPFTAAQALYTYPHA